MSVALKDPDKYPGLGREGREKLRAARDRHRPFSKEDRVREVNAFAASGLSKSQFVMQRDGGNPERRYTAKTLKIWVNEAMENPNWFSSADWDKLQAVHERDRLATQQEREGEINAWAASGLSKGDFVRARDKGNPKRKYTTATLHIWINDALGSPSLFPSVDPEKLKEACTRFGYTAQVRAFPGESGSDLRQEGSYLPEIAAAQIYGEYWKLRPDWPDLPHGVRIAIHPETVQQSPELGAIVVHLNPSNQVGGRQGTSRPPGFLADPGLNLRDPNVIAALSRAGVDDAGYQEAWNLQLRFRHANFAVDPGGQPTAPTLYPPSFADRSGARAQTQAAFPTMPEGPGNPLTTGPATTHLPGPYPHHGHHEEPGESSATRPTGNPPPASQQGKRPARK
ncbi:hypothetical protein OG946_17985 [Streptomyces sp. NBC_01808]|uniref:hypothetical protein n=1 Tax=Streptomyces sp. NBC_01808 TaxID=2975947 RepID=UPI002DD9F1E7|nr:hypothetical protein [Streptomyces sp. NBC_01808]WSA39084.1 hypothetical protein OG946_17985 [Streptomyces sp. NBC_01808]